MNFSLVRFAIGDNAATSGHRQEKMANSSSARNMNMGTTRGRSFLVMCAIIGTIFVGYNILRRSTTPNQPPAGGPSSAYVSKRSE